MSSSSPASLLDVDLQPGKPPDAAQPTPRRRAGLGGRAPGRAARRWSPSTARSWSAASGCATRPRSAPSSRHLAGGADDRDGGLRAPPDLRRRACTPRRSGRPNQPMCMHHELSYTLESPGLMLFACLTAPTTGGATAVADAPTVLDALPAELVERFEREGWLLTRNYNDEIGASLAEAFGTDDRARRRGLLPGQRHRVRVAARRRAAHPAAPQPPWCATRSPAGAAGSTRSPSSTSGRWTRRSASTWSTSTAPTGCRSTPASATATRSARTSSRCSTRSTRPTPHASRGRPAT